MKNWWAKLLQRNENLNFGRLFYYIQQNRTVIGYKKNICYIFVSIIKRFDLLQTQRFLSLKSINDTVWNGNNVRRYSTKSEREELDRDCYTFVLKTINFYQPETRRFLSSQTSATICNQNNIRSYSTNRDQKNPDSDLLTCKNKRKARKPETKVKCIEQEVPKICDKLIQNHNKKNTCETRTKGTAKKEDKKKEICPKKKIQITPLSPKKIEKDKKVESQKTDDALKKQTKQKTHGSLCKRVFPQNKLRRFRPPPAWKVWLYSLMGVDLTISGRKPCHPCRKTVKQVITWVKLEKYPPPLLEPSRKHFSRTPEQRLEIVKSRETKSECVITHTKTDVITHTKADKQASVKSLPANDTDTAKWAVTSPDCNKDEKKSEPKKPETKPLPETKTPSSSSVEIIQKKTSDFCKTLVDLCKPKSKASCKDREKPKTVDKAHGQEKVAKEICQERKVPPVCKDKKTEVPKEICQEKKVPRVCKDKKNNICSPKLCTKKKTPETKKPETKPKKDCKNNIESNAEYTKNKNKGLEMPKRYTCGAGAIERKLIKEKKLKDEPKKVNFKYREHCGRNPFDK